MTASTRLITDVNLKKIVELFPPSFTYAFAYGSGVFKQAKHDMKNSMTDLIFVVDDSLEWHKQNLKTNKKHYSLLRLGGPELITNIQESLGAKIYFNTLVPHESGLLKYGVIDTHHLITDLLDWNTLYISGRLHKPVKVLQQPVRTDLQSALNNNLRSAVHTALLLLPESFTEKELYITLAGLSYAGDFRMLFGEDKKKVVNIVEGELEEFRRWYKPILGSMQEHLNWRKDIQTFEQDLSASANLYHLNLLPRCVQQGMIGDRNRDGNNRDMEEVMQYLARDLFCEEYVATAVKRIVWKSSWKQMFKGILTAGVYKSVRYGAAKIGKMVSGWRR